MLNEPNYNFSAEKNAILKAERGVGFDDVIYCIENGYVLDIIKNKAKKYAHQKIYVVEINNYAYVVPCVVSKEEIFLKTIYQNSTMTKKYIKVRRKK